MLSDMFYNSITTSTFLLLFIIFTTTTWVGKQNHPALFLVPFSFFFLIVFGALTAFCWFYCVFVDYVLNFCWCFCCSRLLFHFSGAFFGFCGVFVAPNYFFTSLGLLGFVFTFFGSSQPFFSVTFRLGILDLGPFSVQQSFLAVRFFVRI